MGWLAVCCPVLQFACNLASIFSPASNIFKLMGLETVADLKLMNGDVPSFLQEMLPFSLNMLVKFSDTKVVFCSSGR